MTVSAETNKATYSGDGSTTSFSTVFTFASNDEVTVSKVVTATGVTTEFTLGTEYTLTGAGTGSAGTVVISTSPSDFTPASGEKLIVQLRPPFVQPTDLPRGGTVSPSDTLEPMHDNRVRQMLRLKDDADRALKLPIDETSAATLPVATLRKGKILSFDSTTGDPQTDQEIGVFKGNWLASTIYVERDIVRDTSTGNVFIANAAHTSSGSLPLTVGGGNPNASAWDLLVDAASATTSQNAAAASAAAALVSQNAASTSASSSSTSAATSSTQAGISTAQAAISTTKANEASASATSAATTLDTFEDTYFGDLASDPTTDLDGDALAARHDGALYFNTTDNTLRFFDQGNNVWKRTTPTSTAQTNIDAVVTDPLKTNINTTAGISSAVSTVAGISSAVSNVSSISAEVSAVNADATDIGVVATDLAGSDTIGTTATNIASVQTTATNIASVQTTAGAVGDISTVAGISADVQSVAGVATQVSAVGAQFCGYTFNTGTNTAVSPGSGKLSFNNATLANVTQISISDIDIDGNNLEGFLTYFDDSTNTTSKATVSIRTGARDVIWLNVTSISDETGFVKFNVQHISSAGTFSANERVFVGLSRTGDVGQNGTGSGTVVGPASSTDNALVRFDTTTGELVQNSTATLSDSGNLSTASVTLTSSTPNGVLVGNGSASAVASTTAGSAGQVLTANSGAPPSFQTISAGGPSLDGNGSGEESIIRTNKNQLTGNSTLIITSGNNGFTAGPLSIAAGSSVSVQSSAVWHLIGA
jgi:hypothetical protein